MIERDRFTVVTPSPTELCWDFSKSTQPYYLTRQSTEWSYRRRLEVDPFPGYSHDEIEAASAAHLVTEIFPIPFHTTFYLLPHEASERMNGWTDRQHNYAEKDRHEWVPQVVLSGKRVPLHPAMTRYLVGHEYGHVVQFWLAAKLFEEHDRTDKLMNAYRELRGGSAEWDRHEYVGGRWHESILEIMACDFRILVTKLESGYWPHPGIQRPEQIPALVDWWNQRRFEALAGAS